jgi:type VI secretion system protein ImpI
MAPALTLKIENEASLPDGGPLSVSVQGKRGIDIGRDQYLDWTLPDPTRTISSKHCEVRWHDGAYWLHDISTNGTFLYGADSRLKEPHRLRNGDRFTIGHYIVVAAVEDEGSPLGPAVAAARAPNYDEIWSPVGETAPPIDPKLLKSARDFQPVKADFLQWAVDVPPSYDPPTQTPPSLHPRSALPDEMAWATGTTKARPAPPPPPPDVVPIPTPRRPVWVAGEPDGPWAAAATPPAPIARVSSSAPGDHQATDSPSRDLRDTPPTGRDAAATGDFIRLMAQGAGVPAETLTARDPAQLAEEIGHLLRMFTESTRQLLDARQQAKRLTRSSNQTMIQALNNNPLKFAPTTEDAMRIMFGPPTQSYLDARRAFRQSFENIKSHQVKTLSAMQHALKQLLADFDPAVIDNTSQADRGLAGVLGSRRAQLWDIYSARWQARTKGNEDGMLNAFMDYFAQYYDVDGKE